MNTESSYRQLIANLILYYLKNKMALVALINLDKDASICYSIYPYMNYLKQDKEKANLKKDLIDLVSSIHQISDTLEDIKEQCVFIDQDPILKDSKFYYNALYQIPKFDKEKIKSLIHNMIISRQTSILNFKLYDKS